MNKIMILLAFLFLGNMLRAQTEIEEVAPKVEEQVGLNFTNFFLRFLSFNEPQEGTPSILVYYKKGNNKIKWRHGFGLQLFRFNEDNKDFNTFAQVDYVFGKEYHQSISKKWRVYFAWEAILSGSYSESKRKLTGGGVNKSWIRRGNTGIQALGGLQFYFNSRLSLLTETSYGFLFQFSEDDDDDKNKTFRSIYTPPISLILSYHF